MVAALTIDGRPARVVVVPGEIANLHVTTPEELELARRLALSLSPRG
jgi:2-C-methyl-D-erythritol 4-phosphate cytidylyltransferase